MHFHGIAPRLLGSPARAAVLASVLAAPEGEFTGREVARLAGVSPARAMVALRILEAEGLCWQRRAGRASLWKVNRRHFLARSLAQVATLESDAMSTLIGLLQRQLRRAGAVEAHMFGSVARGDERATSDIDLVAVFPDEAARGRWDGSLSAMQNKIQANFGNELQAIAYTAAAVRRGGPRRVLERARAEGRPIAGLR